MDVLRGVVRVGTDAESVPTDEICGSRDVCMMRDALFRDEVAFSLFRIEDRAALHF